MLSKLHLLSPTKSTSRTKKWKTEAIGLYDDILMWRGLGNQAKYSRAKSSKERRTEKLGVGGGGGTSL